MADSPLDPLNLPEPKDLWEPYDPAAHDPTSDYHDPIYRARLQTQEHTSQCATCHVYYGGPHRGHNPGEQMGTLRTPSALHQTTNTPIPTVELGGISHGICPGCYTERRRGQDPDIKKWIIG